MPPGQRQFLICSSNNSASFGQYKQKNRGSFPAVK
jgi:hypothetical protein